MIGTLLRIGCINLRRDRVAQALTFLLPIIFFSIFAMVFGNQKSGTRQVRVAVVDEDQSAYSTALVKALQKEGGLAVQTAAGKDAGGAPLDRAAAEQLVKAGTLAGGRPAEGPGRDSPDVGGRRDADGSAAATEDPSDPVAPQVVRGLLAEGQLYRDARHARARRHRDVQEICRPADTRPAGRGGRLDELTPGAKCRSRARRATPVTRRSVCPSRRSTSCTRAPTTDRPCRSTRPASA